MFASTRWEARCAARMPGRDRAARIALVAMAAAASACATSLPPREAAPPEPVQPAPAATDAPRTDATVRHVVLPGQTLWRIARAYGVPLDRLIAANAIGDPTDVPVGTVLVVPGATAPLDVAPFPAPLAAEPDPPRDSFVPDGDWSWPVVGPLSSGFGVPRPRHRHAGIDIRAGAGQPVLASRAGIVVFSGTRKGYGRTVVLDHGDGNRTLYAHNQRLLVQPGAAVERGQPIATVGRTGNATGTHCHFEILQHGTPIDPLSLLPGTTEASR